MVYRVEWRNVHSGERNAEAWQEAELCATRAQAEAAQVQWVTRGYEARILEVEA